MNDFDIKPKMIDYCDDFVNAKYSKNKEENKICNNIADKEKKKKDND